MSPSRILIGQFLIVLTIIVLTMWGATQWTAHELGYQRGLGRPWFQLEGWPVYRPWRLFQWWYAYEAYAPEVFARGGLIAVSGSALGFLAAIIGSVLRSRHERHVTTYGSARWASNWRTSPAPRSAKPALSPTRRLEPCDSTMRAVV